MPLNLKTFEQIRSDLVSSWAAALGLSPSLTSGDPLLAIMESVGSQQIFLQSLCEAVLKYARASTAEGEDLDSWLADFNFFRLPATKAKGQVSFGVKIAKSTNTLVPVGTIIQVPGGAIQYEVVADPVQSGWNETLQGYVITAGSSYVVATVQALEAGYAFNAQPNQITQIISTATGVDTVINTLAITNGLDAETDEAVRNRFILYINSLSRNTRPAISAAILGVQQGINFNLLENIDQNNESRDGFFTVVMDDGSGNPPPELITKVQQAVDLVRGFTIAFTVVAAQKVLIGASMNIKINPNAIAMQVQANVQAAVTSYINSLLIGESLYLYKLIQVAIDADPNVLAVQVNSCKIDNVELDKIATGFQVIRTVPGNVAIGTF